MGALRAQEFVYVNTNNLVMRDRPEKKYRVSAILNAGARLTVEPYRSAFEKNKQVRNRFYRVSFKYQETDSYTLFVGWIEKKYVVSSPDAVNTLLAPGKPQYIPIEKSWDPNVFNAAQFPPPKFKGAEMQPRPKKIVYHPGPRGGCYYINGKGRKVYVDKKYCNGK